MKQIFSILPLLLIGTVHAASMCVPTVASNQSTSYIRSAEEDNNRGYFAVGTGCVSGTNSCRNTLARGESHCSAASILPADNFETNGMYCYCRLTHIRAPNGYLAARSGNWVYRSRFTGTLSNAYYCYTGCARLCAEQFRTHPTFRSALFATPMTLE